MGRVLKNKEKSMVGLGYREEGKAPGAGDGKAVAVDEDVSNDQSRVATGTHRSRPARHVVPVSQPRVSQTESSENYAQRLFP